MIPISATLVALLAFLTVVHPQEQQEHREFQYNSVVDPITGRYNFAYDTGNDNDIAHSLHMQYQDANGIVRGRYGYTDPRGKLRMVEYEAGPDGFVARGDVGPDLFPHDQAPVAGNAQAGVSSYRESADNDLDLDPAPVQMAGWDPAADPIGLVQSDGQYTPQGFATASPDQLESENGNESPGLDQPQYTTLNVTSGNALDVYGPELGFYSGRYPRIIYALSDISNGAEAVPDSFSTTPQTGESTSNSQNNSLNAYNIDVNLDDIREAAGSDVRTDADGNPATVVRRSGHRTQPVRVVADYGYYPRQTHDHDAEQRSRQTHDHDAERRYRYRQTHDHDAEMRSRRYHDHDAERRYPYRQTHDHDAEKYQNHDHSAERAAYYRRYYGRYNYPRRIFYRDSHSMEPHEHYDNPVYRNYRDHQHSDVHLYGRYRNYEYPATARPRQLKYIPADKYHDKRYYWTYS